MLLDDIPGLKRAVDRARHVEETARRRAFIPGALRICTVDVWPLTPRHLIYLDEAQSPLVGFGGEVLGEHVAQFLWIVSRAFVQPSTQIPLRDVRAKRAAFAKQIRSVRYRTARARISAYLDEAFFDAPASKGEGEAPMASTAAGLIDRFACAYGWQIERRDSLGQPVPGEGILDMPLAQLFQLHRLIRARTDESFIATNPLSDKVEIACVRRFCEWEKRQKEKKQKKKKL